MLEIELYALLMMDGNHPKHVEQFPDIKKLCDVASCWIYEYIGILLGARPILHNSRIKVKYPASIKCRETLACRLVM
jgi:hypothetical protein